MKTNYVPALVTLAAGAVDCVIGLCQKWSTMVFVRNLLIVLVVFLVIGTVIKMILDHAFKDFNENPEGENPPEEEEEEDRDKMESKQTEDKGSAAQ